MRIFHLTPGTGSFHCGSCLRDHALIRALRSRGHDAMMAPLYLPLVTDREKANPEIPVQAGGISLNLRQKFPFLSHVPHFALNWVNRPALLRWAGGLISMTSPRDLGEMTLGALQGEQAPSAAQVPNLGCRMAVRVAASTPLRRRTSCYQPQREDVS